MIKSVIIILLVGLFSIFQVSNAAPLYFFEKGASPCFELSTMFDSQRIGDRSNSTLSVDTRNCSDEVQYIQLRIDLQGLDSKGFSVSPDKIYEELPPHSGKESIFTVSYPGSTPDGKYSVGVITEFLAGSAVISRNYSNEVLIIDTSPPVINEPENIVIGAPTADGAEISYEVSAEDNVDGPVDLFCAPSSGNTFPIGETVVTCTAEDSAGNIAETSFTVTVYAPSNASPSETEEIQEEIQGFVPPMDEQEVDDITSPDITVPEDVIVETTAPDGAQVSFEEEVSAEDNVDGPVDLFCAPSSGNTFPIGETVVTCTAEDSAGNIAEELFTVIVQETGSATDASLPESISDASTPFLDFFDNAYFIILVSVAALGSAYYGLVLRKKSITGLQELSKHDYPRFFFERLSKGFTARSIVFYMALIFFSAVFLPDFILFQLVSQSYSYDIYTLMRSHLGAFIVIISTILVGILYRNKFFEIFNIFELGPTTLASIKRSFLARKQFFICLALLETPLLYNYIISLLVSSADNNPYSGFEIGIIIIMIFFIPLGAQIYAAFWSGMLSIRSIIRESVPLSQYSEVALKIKKMTSIWKWPFLIWITSTMIGVSLAAPSLIFTIYVMWLYLLSAIIFAVSHLLVHRDLLRFKRLSLKEIERTSQQSQWELQISLLDKSGLSKEEMDRALKSYDTGLNDVRKQVNKMPTWLFSHRMVVGLSLYTLTLIFIEVLIVGYYYYSLSTSGSGGS